MIVVGTSKTYTRKLHFQVGKRVNNDKLYAVPRRLGVALHDDGTVWNMQGTIRLIEGGRNVYV